MSFIVTHKLYKKYGDDFCALSDVTMTVEKGEWLAIMGPSGSGKTTLINIIGGLDKPTEGVVIVGGTDITRLNKKELTLFRREKVGLVFQQYHLIPYLTVLENVMLAQYYHSMVDERQAKEALEAVGLGDRLDRLPSQLSGGEQQRVCIARAVINEPDIILADEPTGNLDEKNEALVMEIFRNLHRRGHTILLVTHDPEIGQLADRRIQLHHGRLSDVTVNAEPATKI